MTLTEFLASVVTHLESKTAPHPNGAANAVFATTCPDSHGRALADARWRAAYDRSVYGQVLSEFKRVASRGGHCTIHDAWCADPRAVVRELNLSIAEMKAEV